MHEDSSSYDYPSLSQRFDSRMLTHSERDNSINFNDIIRKALKDYEDVD